jgi:hypothetical protein
VRAPPPTPEVPEETTAVKVSAIKAKNERKEKGAWINELNEIEGVSVKVRGMNNVDYNRRLTEISRDLTPEQRVDPDTQREVQTQLLVETVLLDWKGVEDEDGKPLECTPAMALKILSDPDMLIFRTAVIDAAINVTARGIEKLESAAKN